MQVYKQVGSALASLLGLLLLFKFQKLQLQFQFFFFPCNSVDSALFLLVGVHVAGFAQALGVRRCVSVLTRRWRLCVARDQVVASATIAFCVMRLCRVLALIFSDFSGLLGPFFFYHDRLFLRFSYWRILGLKAGYFHSFSLFWWLIFLIPWWFWRCYESIIFWSSSSLLGKIVRGTKLFKLMLLEESILEARGCVLQLFHDEFLGQNLVVNICATEYWDHFLFSIRK